MSSYRRRYAMQRGAPPPPFSDMRADLAAIVTDYAELPRPNFDHSPAYIDAVHSLENAITEARIAVEAYYAGKVKHGAEARRLVQRAGGLLIAARAEVRK